MRYLLPMILIGIQLAQGMAVPHSHAGTGVAEPAEHAQRPHFHLCLPSHHEHPHGHCHPHRGIGEEPLTLPADPEVPPADHDSDAVYFSDALPVGRVMSSSGASDHWQQFLPAPGVMMPSVATLPAVVPPRSLSPPGGGHFHCPIYLQTLALLI